MAQLLGQVRAEIAAGDLNAAEATLRQARRVARAATEGAQLREAEVIGVEAQTARLRADFLAAAALYAEAAETAPESGIEARWRYRYGLGSVLYNQGLRFGGDATAQAVQVLREEALPLAPRAERPVDWAKAQSSLGAAFHTLGMWSGGPAAMQALADAIAAHRAALEVYTRADFPVQWANTQIHLGDTLHTLGQRRESYAAAEALQDAVSAYEAGQGVYTRTDFPVEWASAQYSKARALTFLGIVTGERAPLTEALAAIEEAMEVFRANDMDDYLADAEGLREFIRRIRRNGPSQTRIR